MRLSYGSALSYEIVAEVFREHAALTTLVSAGARDLDGTSYETLASTQYPVPAGVASGSQLSTNWRFSLTTARPGS
jgi:hypothetical protein